MGNFLVGECWEDDWVFAWWMGVGKIVCGFLLGGGCWENDCVGFCLVDGC